MCSRSLGHAMCFIGAAFLGQGIHIFDSLRLEKTMTARRKANYSQWKSYLERQAKRSAARTAKMKLKVKLETVQEDTCVIKRQTVQLHITSQMIARRLHSTHLDRRSMLELGSLHVHRR